MASNKKGIQPPDASEIEMANKKLKIGIQTYTCEGVFLNGTQLTKPTGIYLDGVKTLFWEPGEQAFYFLPQPRENIVSDTFADEPISGYLADATGVDIISEAFPQKLFDGWTKENVCPYSGVFGAVRMQCALNNFRLGDISNDNVLPSASESEAPFYYPIENTSDPSIVGNLESIVREYGSPNMNPEEKPVFVNTPPNTFSFDSSGIILPPDVPFSVATSNTYMCFWNNETIHGKLLEEYNLYAMSYDPYALAYVAGYNFQGHDQNMTILITDVLSEEEGKAQANAILKGLYDSFGNTSFGGTTRVIITNATLEDWETAYTNGAGAGKSLFSANLITNSPIAMPLVNKGINTCAYYACFPIANKYTYFNNMEEGYGNGVAAIGPVQGSDLSDGNYQLSNLYIYHYSPYAIGENALGMVVSGGAPDESQMFITPSRGANVLGTHTLDPLSSGNQYGYEAMDVGSSTTAHSITQGEETYISSYSDDSGYGIVPLDQSNRFIGNSAYAVNGLFSPGGPNSVALYVTLQSGTGANNALKYLWN